MPSSRKGFNADLLTVLKEGAVFNIVTSVVSRRKLVFFSMYVEFTLLLLL